MKRTFPVLMALLVATCITIPDVSLSWTPNTETDLAGYEVYRATVEAGPYTRLAGTATAAYADVLPNEGSFFYKVTAVDTCGNVSAMSPSKEVRYDGTAPAAPAAPTITGG